MIICFLKKDEQNAILFLSLNTFCLERKRVDHPLRLVVLFTCKVLMASRTWCSVRKFPVSRSDCGKYPKVIRNINCCRRNKIKQKIQRVITGYHTQSITLDIFFLLVSVAILNCYSVFRWEFANFCRHRHNFNWKIVKHKPVRAILVRIFWYYTFHPNKVAI